VRYAAILALLNTHLQTFPGWSDAACAWPNRPFTPTPGVGWWKVDFIPSTVEYALGASGAIHERGIYQVTRYEPASKGAAAGLGASDSMASHFSRQVLAGSGLSVACGIPELGPCLSEPDWFASPLSIRFTAL